MDNEKLLTIAIPTYNGANTISNMLEILLPQCDERVEILISDNASTDNTKLIISILKNMKILYMFVMLKILVQIPIIYNVWKCPRGSIHYYCQMMIF